MNLIRTWWNVSTLLTTAMGVALTLAALAPEASGLIAVTDLAFPGSSPGSAAPPELLTLLYGVAGGTTAGLGIACRGAGLMEPRTAAIVALIVWYVLDSAASVVSGGVWNAVSNTAILLMLMPAVVMLRR